MKILKRTFSSNTGENYGVCSGKTFKVSYLFLVNDDVVLINLYKKVLNVSINAIEDFMATSADVKCEYQIDMILSPLADAVFNIVIPDGENERHIVSKIISEDECKNIYNNLESQNEEFINMFILGNILKDTK